MKIAFSYLTFNPHDSEGTETLQIIYNFVHVSRTQLSNKISTKIQEENMRAGEFLYVKKISLIRSLVKLDIFNHSRKLERVKHSG